MDPELDDDASQASEIESAEGDAPLWIPDADRNADSDEEPDDFEHLPDGQGDDYGWIADGSDHGGRDSEGESGGDRDGEEVPASLFAHAGVEGEAGDEGPQATRWRPSHTAPIADWTFPRFRGENAGPENRESRRDVTPDFGWTGGFAFGFPRPFKQNEDNSSFAALMALDPSVSLPFGRCQVSTLTYLPAAGTARGSGSEPPLSTRTVGTDTRARRGT